MQIVGVKEPGGDVSLPGMAKLCAFGEAESSNYRARRTFLLASASLAVFAFAGGLAVSPAAAQTVATTTTLQATAGGATADDIAIAAGFQEAVTGDAILTLDLDDLDATTATIINDSSGSAAQQLTIRVLDADLGAFSSNDLTIAGPVTASNGGTIVLEVGPGLTNNVGLIFQDDISETSGGVVRIETGAGTSSRILTFNPTDATQTVDAAISSSSADATLRLRNTSVAVGATITFTDTVLLDVNDPIDIQETAGDLTVVFETDVTGDISVNGGSLILGRAGATSTVTGTIAGTGGGATSTLQIADGANVVLDGQFNDVSTGWTSITVGEGSATSFTLNGNTSNDSPITLSDNAILIVQTTNAGAPNISGGIFADATGSFTTLRVIGDPGNFATFTVNSLGAADNRLDLIDLDAGARFSNAPHFLGSLDIASGVTARFAGSGTDLASIAGDVSGEGEILISNLDNVLTFDGGSTAQTISTPILFNVNQHGIIQTANTAGLTFDGPIGGVNAAQDVNIASGNIVTFNGVVVTDGFEVLGPDTVVTVNGGEVGTATRAISGGRLQIGQSTIILGSNIGDGDTVFDFPSSDRPIMPGSETITVQVSAHVGEGDEIILFSTDDDQSEAVDSVVDLGMANGEVSVVDTALTDFSLNLATVTATSDAAITLTARDRSTEETADILGVSQDDVIALSEAIEAAETAGDAGEETLAGISEALNEGTDSPQTAASIAQQVGVQSDGLGAGSSVSAFIAGEQRTVTGNRLASQRSGFRFASAFSQTGFSGGDERTGTSLSRSFWLQAFGGVANADGDAGHAGFDSSFGGITVGVDGAINDHLTIGAFGGYTFATVEGQGAGNAGLETTGYQLGVYGSFTGQSFYLDGFASFDFSDNSATRSVTLPAAGTYAADFTSNQVSLALSGGMPVEVREGFFITPNASLAWNSYNADSYVETGSGVLANAVSDVSATQLTGSVGARIHAVYEDVGARGTTLVPELRLGLSYDLVSDNAVASARFAGGTTAYTVTGTDIDDLAALIGLGLAMQSSVWSAGITYDADLRSDYVSHTARAEFRWTF